MNSTKKYCPALLISAPASGQGKTTVTAALARMHTNLGRKVQIFKCGPDFLDPMILKRASNRAVYQLDLWIQGEDECRRLLWQAAQQVDLILVEGVMGLFDGAPSTADLARLFNIPVMAVIDAGSMSKTLAAVAFGLAHFMPELPFAGVFANRSGSERHTKILRAALEDAPHEIIWLGALPRSADIELPGRHLGLLQADEVEDLDQRLNKAAAALEISNTALPAGVEFNGPVYNVIYDEATANLPLTGLRIAIANDAAFSFIYQANLDLLEELGASISFFSPIHDAGLPDVDSIYLPGGYPELHLQALHDNVAMLEDIQKHYKSGKVILAECGGMLYLLESLKNHTGLQLSLAGILPGAGKINKQLSALGAQEVELPEGILRGHTFHYSVLDTKLAPLCFGRYHTEANPTEQRRGEAVYRSKRLTASYIHFYFPSNPQAIVALFKGRGSV